MEKSSKDNEKSAPITMQEDDGEILLYTFEVGGIGSVNAVIASGANACMIRRDVLTDSIISKIEPTITSIRLLDGSNMELLGCVNLFVSYLGKEVEMPFYVVPELLYPMSLGANWIRKSGAILQSDGAKLVVTLGGKKQKEGCKLECSPPCLSVEVDGIGIVRALVDTATSRSSIREDMVKDSKIPVIPSDIPITMINDSQEKTGGVVNLNVLYEYTTTRIENVSTTTNPKANADYPLILGMDWIRKSRVVIQSDGSKLVVSQRKKGNIELFTNWLSATWNSIFEPISIKNVNKEEPEKLDNTNE